MPTTWDDSKVLDGFPGQFIIMARKSGEDWFLGGINADQPREVVLSLQFLGINPGKAIDVSEVLIEGDQVGSRFHRVCGNPDIVCGNRRSLTLELHCDPAEAVCRFTFFANRDPFRKPNRSSPETTADIRTSSDFLTRSATDESPRIKAE